MDGPVRQRGGSRPSASHAATGTSAFEKNPWRGLPRFSATIQFYGGVPARLLRGGCRWLARGTRHARLDGFPSSFSGLPKVTHLMESSKVMESSKANDRDAASGPAVPKSAGATTQAISGAARPDPLKSPALWNPTAAAAWSILFTPAFGALLHSINWRALGRRDRAATNVLWIAATVVFLTVGIIGIVGVGVGVGITGPKVIGSIVRLAYVGLFLGWYFTQGKPQATYVHERYGDSYTRKSLVLPLVVGLAGIGFYLPLMNLFARALTHLGNAERGGTQVDISDAIVGSERRNTSTKASVSGFSKDYSVLLREVRNSFDIKEDGYYHLSDTHAVSELRSTTDGVLIEESQSEELPDEANGEYSRLQLMLTEDGRTIMIEESRSGLGDGQIHELKAEFEMEFVNGDWPQFEEGNDVVLRYSEKGIRDVESKAMEEVRVVLQAAVRIEVPGVIADVVASPRFPNSTIVANKKSVRSTVDGPIQMVLRLKGIAGP